MKIILYLIIFAVLFIAFVRFIESTSIFYPSRFVAVTPRDIGLPFEDVYILTQDNIKVHGWLVQAPQAKSILIFFHGNAGNIGDRLEKIGLFHRMGLNVLIIDYRGYGKSEGRPTEKGIYADATAAYDYLAKREDMKGRHIIAYGASLGGAVAVDLAVQRPLSCLILDSTFSRAADVAKRIYPFIPSFLFATKMDSIGKIRALSVPKLFIHSVEDSTIPFALGKKLYEAAPAPKEFIEITGDHNDGYLLNEAKILDGMTVFLKNLDML